MSAIHGVRRARDQTIVNITMAKNARDEPAISAVLSANQRNILCIVSPRSRNSDLLQHFSCANIQPNG